MTSFFSFTPIVGTPTFNELVPMNLLFSASAGQLLSLTRDTEKHVKEMRFLIPCYASSSLKSLEIKGMIYFYILWSVSYSFQLSSSFVYFALLVFVGSKV